MRNKFIGVRVTEAEQKKIKSNAKKQGLSSATYIRLKALGK